MIGMSMQSPINALRSTIEQILSIQIVHFKILLEASKWIFGRREFGNILMYLWLTKGWIFVECEIKSVFYVCFKDVFSSL